MPTTFNTQERFFHCLNKTIFFIWLHCLRDNWQSRKIKYFLIVEKISWFFGFLSLKPTWNMIVIIIYFQKMKKVKLWRGNLIKQIEKMWPWAWDMEFTNNETAIILIPRRKLYLFDNNNNVRRVFEIKLWEQYQFPITVLSHLTLIPNFHSVNRYFELMIS